MNQAPQYCIGLTFPPTALDAYSPAISWPMRSTPELYSVTFPRADGSVFGGGFPFTVWEFDYLTQPELNHLLGLLTVGGALRKSRSGVYIKTRSATNHDLFQVYTAIMILPDGLTQNRMVASGLYANVKFEFRRLVAYP